MTCPFDELEQKVVASGYEKLPALLNEDNLDNLFVGPNNLLQRDRIEEVNVYSKPIYSFVDLNRLEGQEKSTKDPIQILVGDSPGSDTVPISNHLLCFLRLGKGLTSHQNIVHGGAIATIMDEFLVKVALPFTTNNFAVTASLDIKYVKPLKFENEERLLNVVLECFVIGRKEGRKFDVSGYLKSIEGNYRYCKGELLVVVPRDCQ